MTATSLEPSLIVRPLGGCGEVGLNATLLQHGDEAILIDCGMMLGLADAPGVDLAVPDFEALRRDGRRLLSVLVTHGHEDHIGGVGRLLEEFDVPVHAPPLATRLLESRLDGHPGKLARLESHEPGERIGIGPFSVELVRVTHSIPDSVALHIETPAGRVLHTGDFKLDEHPADGKTTDIRRLRAIGDLGVDLMLSDSTNSERPGRTRSERDVALELERTIAEAEGRVVVSCFASHIHRMKAILQAAEHSGRRVALLGRSLKTNFRIAISEGLIDMDPSELVDESRVMELPRDEVLVLATGTQGETRAALSRVARGEDPSLRLTEGDRVVISAMAIPGNQRTVRRLQNMLVRMGVEVVTDRMRAVHCSGHAHRDEQVEMLQMIRPRTFVPVHGERCMLEAHARTAQGAGLDADAVRVIENGESVRLSGGGLTVGDRETAHMRFVDGVSGAYISWNEVGARRKVGFGGLVVASVVVDDQERLLATPAVTIEGLPGSSDRVVGVQREIEAAMTAAGKRGHFDPERVVKSAIKREIQRTARIRPLTRVHVLRVRE